MFGFNCGLAEATQNGKNGYIDVTGKKVWVLE